MAVIMIIQREGGGVTRIHDDCLPRTPEEKSLRDRQVAAVITRIFENPENRERLRQYNLEHYGEE